MKNGKLFDNRHVVPYNAYLLLKYNCHINVEICFSIRCVKYMYKYVYKGHDRSNILIEDEIQSFLDCRYLCAQEACWRLFQFKMEESMHTVYRMAIHLPDQQTIMYQTGQEEAAVAESEKKPSMLLGWFELNKISVEARTLLYTEVGVKYVWNKTTHKWTLRQVLL
jgi:hypothetical protein